MGPRPGRINYSVRPLLARVLSVELRKACSSVWGFVRLTMFAKAVLRIPATNSQRRRFVMSSVLLDRLHIWNQSGSFHSLWNSLLDDLKISKPRGGVSHGLYCKARALFWAREGRYSNALQTLSSQGVAAWS